MDKYVIEAGAAWRLYHPMPVPAGWRMLGPCGVRATIGALGRSPAGLFAQINAGAVRVLDQRAVADAERSVRAGEHQ